MRNITCHCDQHFMADIPDVINLDSNPEYYASIQDNTFLTCICPACNAELRLDLETRIEWASKNATVIMLPEIERLAYLGDIKAVPGGIPVVFGYAELCDRLAVVKDELDCLSIEAIKYHLATKASEGGSIPNLEILYNATNDRQELVFHIFGLKENEMAVTRVPVTLYDTIREDVRSNPGNPLYTGLQNKMYISCKNILIEDTAHD